MMKKIYAVWRVLFQEIRTPMKICSIVVPYSSCLNRSDAIFSRLLFHPIPCLSFFLSDCTWKWWQRLMTTLGLDGIREKRGMLHIPLPFNGPSPLDIRTWRTLAEGHQVPSCEWPSSFLGTHFIPSLHLVLGERRTRWVLFWSDRHWPNLLLCRQPTSQWRSKSYFVHSSPEHMLNEPIASWDCCNTWIIRMPKFVRTSETPCDTRIDRWISP